MTHATIRRKLAALMARGAAEVRKEAECLRQLLALLHADHAEEYAIILVLLLTVLAVACKGLIWGAS